MYPTSSWSTYSGYVMAPAVLSQRTSRRASGPMAQSTSSISSTVKTVTEPSQETCQPGSLEVHVERRASSWTSTSQQKP
ncbi:hypothetical protein ACFVFJ_29480 [Streptomyces sp. NPDC057717]|uniref:hypothetical protein n=1 Tax=Streptomyces sp. NPDC057717 TaxID=3346224 RepID=UPI0036CEC507